MKTKSNYLLAISVLVVCSLSSCDSKIKEVNVKPLTTEINGEIKEYVQIIENTYKIYRSSNKTLGGGYNYSIEVNVSNISSENREFFNLTDMKLEVLDNQGNSLSGMPVFELSSFQSGSKLETLLKTKGASDILIFTGYVEKGSIIHKKGLPEPSDISGFIINSQAKINYYSDIANKYWKDKNGDVLYLGGWGKGRNITKAEYLTWELRPEKDLIIDGVLSKISKATSDKVILENGDIKLTMANDRDCLVGKWEATVEGNKVKMIFSGNGNVTLYVNNYQQNSANFSVRGNKILSGPSTVPFKISENKNNLEIDFGSNAIANLKRMNCSYKELTTPTNDLFRPEDPSTNTEVVAYNHNNSKNNSNNNFSKLLTDYEAFVDKYIQLLNKSKNGDLSAMTEYASMLEKAYTLQESLSNAEGEMTSAQLQKFD
jgi:hypothetical protein